MLLCSKAPEAANILWENLELTKKERAHRKTLTLWVTIALLGASFAFLYASNIAEKEYNAEGEAFLRRRQGGRAGVVSYGSVQERPFRLASRRRLRRMRDLVRLCISNEIGLRSGLGPYANQVCKATKGHSQNRCHERIRIVHTCKSG